MKKMVLVKGRSYSTSGFMAVKGVPFFIDDDAEAERLYGTGRFDVLEECSAPKEEPDGNAAATEEKTVIPLEKMKKDEIIAYAADKGIDITGCRTNEERIAIVRAAMEPAGNAEPAAEAEPAFDTE